MLNCKDEKRFQQVYEDTIQRHFAKQAQRPPKKKEQDYSELARSMGPNMPEKEEEEVLVPSS